MMFDLDEDIYDENKNEEIEHKCPWTITVPLSLLRKFQSTTGIRT